MKMKGVSAVQVKLSGLTGILFDRFVDMSADARPPEQKLYLNDKNELVLPSENILSFLFGEDPGGCCRMFEGKKWKDYKIMGMSHVRVGREQIPFTRSGSPVAFTKFVDDYDKGAKIRLLRHKANVKKGKLVIPSPKVRPMLEAPWDLEFEVEVFDNPLITTQKIKNYFTSGGIIIALGTFRPRYGQFTATFKDL